MSVPLRLEDGQPGEATAFDGRVLQIVAPRAFAPGAPVAMWLEPEQRDALELQGKSLGSKRRDDDRFEVRLRMVNLRREHRQTLEAELAKTR